MKLKIKIAVAQYDIFQETEDNLKVIKRLIRRCKNSDVELLVLPEDGIAKPEIVERGYDVLKVISSLVKESKMYIAGANFYKEQDGQLCKIGFLFNPDGEMIAEHKKICLPPTEVTLGLVPGNLIKVYDTPLGRVAILICKDTYNRYSSWLFQDLRKKGVEIIIIPASSLDVNSRSLSLYRETLISNCYLTDAYFLVSGTVGNLVKYSCFGHALVICPRRGVLTEGTRYNEDLLICEIDSDNLKWIKDYDQKWQPEDLFDYLVN